jgi:hypothetical protein
VAENGGFDVIVGNPPYVPVKKLTYSLEVQDFRSSDLYAYVIRRCFQIINQDSRYGFIVMHNLAFSKNFGRTRKLIESKANKGWFSFFSRIPAGLFSGDVRVRNCIFILEQRKDKSRKNFYTTKMHRWYSGERDSLFSKIRYASFLFTDIIPMYSSTPLATFFKSSEGKALSYYEAKASKHKLYFKQSAYNWIAVSNKPAPCYDENGNEIEQSQVSYLSLCGNEEKTYSLLLLNGKMFFSRWLTFGDDFHVTKDDLISTCVPFDKINNSDRMVLKKLAEKFESELQETIQYKLNAGKKVGTYNTAKLWYITDQSDKIFLKYLCANPDDIFESLDIHVLQTSLTGLSQSDREEVQ